MPFIVQDRRTIIDEFGLDEDRLGEIQYGDVCYFYYVQMVRKWKENPRWTTAHNIYAMIVFDKAQYTFCAEACRDNLDRIAAQDLAWQVFFQLHVMKYEEQKRIENGDI